MVKRISKDEAAGRASQSEFPEVSGHDTLPGYSRARVRDAVLNEHGHEVLDSTPMAPPVGYQKQPSLFDTIRAQVRRELLLGQDMDPESIDEADDFEIGDDYDPQSRWENDNEPSIKELRARAAKAEAELKAAEKAESDAAASNVRSPVTSSGSPSSGDNPPAEGRGGEEGGSPKTPPPAAPPRPRG